MVPAGPAAAYPYADVNLTGHGYGSGAGMGQWGALGYALQGLSYQQILSTYYGTLSAGGETSVGGLPNGWNDATTPVTVAMTENAGDDVIVTSASSFLVDGTTMPANSAALFHLSVPASNQWTVSTGPGCGGPWTQVATSVTSPVASPMPGSEPFPGNVASAALTLCMNPTSVTVRGTLQGTVNSDNSDNSPRTVNVLPLGQYVADVTPSESPASWGALGGGEGLQELEAQAVAARSYVMSSYGGLKGYFGYADICDSTACQDYPGIANESTVTDTAVTDTADMAVLMPGGATVATTQYSSSTGGYSAGGTFAAVVDNGDSVCVPGACNSHHTWQAQVPVAAVDSAYPQIGTLESVDVTQRNGLGDLGGRVVAMTVQGSTGSVTVSGNAFASQFAQYGLQSNWFSITNESSGGIGGYWLAGSDGGVFSFGDAGFHGSAGNLRLVKPVVGMAATSDDGGYWLVASDGGVFSYGDAGFHGSAGNLPLVKPVVGMAPTPDGGGYWLVASDGGVFSYGDAAFHGSMGGKKLDAPVVGMAPTPDGGGYWLVASDGGVFSYGDAGFHGSTGNLKLAQPVVGMAPTPDGGGYWLVASDGGVFSFGDSGFSGSLPGAGVHATAVALLGTRTGGGYLIVTAEGRAVEFGDAPQFGDVADAVAGWSGRLVGGALVAG